MKNVIKITIFRRKRSSVIIHDMKVKSMFSNIKNEKTKMIKKTDDIMHSKLQIKEVK